MPRQQKLKRPATSAAAESHARDVNLKLQLTLARQLRRAERDRQAHAREAELRERELLLDLARILDAKLTPSIDDWFERRRVAQVSLLASMAPVLALPPPAELGDPPAGGEPSAAAQHQHQLSMAERQRILEAKRADWLGLSSVPPMPALRQRPMTAAPRAAAAADDDESDAAEQPPGDPRCRGSAQAERRRGGFRPKSAAPAAASAQRLRVT